MAEESATFGDVLANLLLMGAEGRLRKFLHHIALVDIATNPDPFQRSLADLRFGNQMGRVRRTMLGGDVDEIAALRDELRPDLDDLIRLSVSTVAVRFCRPHPGACIEVRRGASNAMGRIEGGRLLLNASFELHFDDDAICAEEDHFHELRYLARSEVVTIDQRALVAIGELLGETSDGAHHDAGIRPLRLPAGLGFA